MTKTPKIPIGRYIHQTDLMLLRSFQKRLETFDISPEQWTIVTNLSIQDGITQQALSEKVEKDQTNVTRIIDKLEKKEFVRRSAHPNDRRAFLLFLTDKGHKLREDTLFEAEREQEKILQGITADEEELLLNILVRLRKNANVCDK